MKFCFLKERKFIRVFLEGLTSRILWLWGLDIYVNRRICPPDFKAEGKTSGWEFRRARTSVWEKIWYSCLVWWTPGDDVRVCASWRPGCQVCVWDTGWAGHPSHLLVKHECRWRPLCEMVWPVTLILCNFIYMQIIFKNLLRCLLFPGWECPELKPGHVLWCHWWGRGGEAAVSMRGLDLSLHPYFQMNFWEIISLVSYNYFIMYRNCFLYY